MILKHFEQKLLGTNNYLIIDEKSKDAALIDCSDFTIEMAKAFENINLKYILLTHGHFDHVLGVNKVREKYGAKVFINKDDLYWLKNINSSIKQFGLGQDLETPQTDRFLKDGDIITVGDMKIKAISTAGHTQGGMCFLVNDCLFSGDTIFKLAVGRCDLYGGDFSQLKSNIENKIFTLDKNIKIYAGHGEFSTVGFEKEHNKFL